jgi:hypothetical protein
MPWFGRLSLDSYRAGPISATEALGHFRTVAAQKASMAIRRSPQAGMEMDEAERIPG